MTFFVTILGVLATFIAILFAVRFGARLSARIEAAKGKWAVLGVASAILIVCAIVAIFLQPITSEVVRALIIIVAFFAGGIMHPVYDKARRD